MAQAYSPLTALTMKSEDFGKRNSDLVAATQERRVYFQSLTGIFRHEEVPHVGSEGHGEEESQQEHE